MIDKDHVQAILDRVRPFLQADGGEHHHARPLRPIGEFPELQEIIKQGLADGTISIQGQEEDKPKILSMGVDVVERPGRGIERGLRRRAHGARVVTDLRVGDPVGIARGVNISLNVRRFL